jgi:hypothetical protein
MSSHKRTTRTKECTPSSGTKKCRKSMKDRDFFADAKSMLKVLPGGGDAQELAEQLRAWAFSAEESEVDCDLHLPTMKVNGRAPTIAEVEAIETLDLNDDQWQEQAAKKISDLYYALYTYKCAVKRTKVLQTKNLERQEVELLEETERLILCLGNEKREYENLKKQQANLANTQIVNDVTLPVAGDTANAILHLNKNASAEELTRIRSLCVAYLKQLDSAAEMIEGRKQTLKMKLDLISKQLVVKKMVVKDLRTQLKKEQKSADSKILELRVRNEDETREKLDALLTPKIAKMMKRRDALMKAWNNGLGERCEGCGKVLKIDSSGSSYLHRACLKKLY